MGKSTIHGWIRRINGDRLEIFLKVEAVEGQPDRKIRASGPMDDMMELVEWFEAKTGFSVSSPILPRRAPQPIPGQIELALGERLEQPEENGQARSRQAEVA